jgi:hypothetical protein
MLFGVRWILDVDVAGVVIGLVMMLLLMMMGSW